jgi:hypothetical protein
VARPSKTDPGFPDAHKKNARAREQEEPSERAWVSRESAHKQALTHGIIDAQF